MLLTEVTPVMDAKHNGEGRSWEKLPRVVLLVDVIEAMRRSEGESVPNLKEERERMIFCQTPSIQYTGKLLCMN